MQARPITHYHASVFQTRSAAVVLATVLANDILSVLQTSNVFFFLLKYIIYVIIASFYIFYASSVALTILLLKKPSN